MLTIGSVSREDAAQIFAFLSPRFRGRRAAIKELTHRDPDFVFWIFPDGRLHDARDAHRSNVPRGYEHIVDDEPGYCVLPRLLATTSTDTLRGLVLATDGAHDLLPAKAGRDQIAPLFEDGQIARRPALLEARLEALASEPGLLHDDVTLVALLANHSRPQGTGTNSMKAPV
jgi:hypothetical protein